MSDTVVPADSTTCPSLVLTAVGISLDTYDVQGLAEQLGVDVAPLIAPSDDATTSHIPTLQDVVGEQHPIGALLVGTGNADLDFRSAAALGCGVIVVTDAPDSTAVQLTVQQASACKATVVAVVEPGKEKDVALPSAEALAAITPVIGPELFEQQLIVQARTTGARIVLPEGDDDRVLTAAAQILNKKVCDLTILGIPEAIEQRAQALGISLEGAELVDPLTSDRFEAYAEEFARLRAKKGVTIEQARKQLEDVSYFGTMMVQCGDADGMVSGAAHTTAETIRPALQIIKTVAGASVVSSLFFIVLPGRVWGVGDCAVNVNPTAQQLGEIAVVSARTAEQFGIDPKVAMLSYSTGTSGSGPDVDRCVEAVVAARQLDDSVVLDGPLQFDAATTPDVAAKKAPESDVAGQANVLIFPDLEAGNIGYKAIQRTASALAVGPVLQGLNKPVNDLSRGATVADIVNTVAITAIQTKGQK